MQPGQRRFLARCLPSLFLLVGLSDCTGAGEFLEHTFSNPAHNPNLLIADSETVRLVRGLDLTIEPLEMEPGNIWPKFDSRNPTLRGSEDHFGREDKHDFGATTTADDQSGLLKHLQPRLGRTNSPPLGQVGPTLPRVSISSVAALRPTANASRLPDGVVSIPKGSIANAGSTNVNRQLNTPSGPGAIVVPNGNGSSTVIYSDGTVRTISTRP